MTKKPISVQMIPNRPIEQTILFIRGQKIILDADLAKLYGVTTKQLNQQVKRNRDRFPGDFMFQLTPTEKKEVVTICDHLAQLKYSPVLPYAFTKARDQPSEVANCDLKAERGRRPLCSEYFGFSSKWRVYNYWQGRR